MHQEIYSKGKSLNLGSSGNIEFEILKFKVICYAALRRPLEVALGPLLVHRPHFEYHWFSPTRQHVSCSAFGKDN